MKTLTKISLCLLLLRASTILSQSYCIKLHFDTLILPPVPDYSNAASWAALPNKKDYADSTPAGLTDNQANALADVFYIYPTTYTDKPRDKYLWNADIGNKKLKKKTDETSILYQASLFNGSCKVYAPYYRQAHYSAFLTESKLDKKRALELAYNDVKAAFEYYLKHYNNGRPIVIASHSQGTVHAVRLLQEFFLNQPLQNKLIVAYLVGMPVNVDSLPTLSPCRDSLQINCFTCWNTFRKNYIPKYYAYGLVNAVCTNPISWTLDDAYVAATNSKGAVVPPYSTVRPKLCDAQVHQGLLWITKPKFPGSFTIRTPIYHAGDYNLFYMDVRTNLDLRIRTYFKIQ